MTHPAAASGSDNRFRQISARSVSALLAALVLHAAASAQTPAQTSRNVPAEAVAWIVSGPETQAVKAGDLVTVVLKGDVRDGWHVYGLEQPSRGPLPMRVSIAKSDVAASDGKPIGSAPTKMHDANFGLETQYYTDKFILNVPVRIGADVAGRQLIPVNVQYQACDGVVCLLPKTIQLSVPVDVRGG